ncbi:MAG: ImmA/IrrE family metallo-endopeptidase [Gaiellales bacterium]
MARAHVREAEAAARVAREELGLGLDAPVPDILRLVEETENVPVAVLRLGSGVAGAYLVRRDRSFVFLNGTQAVQRQRFTLGHELGHHRLRHAAVVDGVETVEGHSNEPLEQQANAFAGQFLAPDQALRSWMDAHGDPKIDVQVLVRLATWFGISVPAAFVRLSQAEILRNQRQRQELQRLIDRGTHGGVQKAMGLQPVEDSLARLHRENRYPYVPARLRDNALTAYAAGLIDLDRLAGTLRTTRPKAEELVASLGIEQAEPEPDW